MERHRNVTQLLSKTQKNQNLRHSILTQTSSILDPKQKLISCSSNCATYQRRRKLLALKLGAKIVKGKVPHLIDVDENDEMFLTDVGVKI